MRPGSCRLRRCARRSVSWAFPPPTAALAKLGVLAELTEPLPPAKHVFTHLIWEMEIHAFVADAPNDVPDGRWVNAAELAALPMPTAVKAARKFAEEALTRANA